MPYLKLNPPLEPSRTEADLALYAIMQRLADVDVSQKLQELARVGADPWQALERLPAALGCGDLELIKIFRQPSSLDVSQYYQFNTKEFRVALQGYHSARISSEFMTPAINTSNWYLGIGFEVVSTNASAEKYTPGYYRLYLSRGVTRLEASVFRKDPASGLYHMLAYAMQYDIENRLGHMCEFRFSEEDTSDLQLGRPRFPLMYSSSLLQLPSRPLDEVVRALVRPERGAKVLEQKSLSFEVACNAAARFLGKKLKMPSKTTELVEYLNLPKLMNFIKPELQRTAPLAMREEQDVLEDLSRAEGWMDSTGLHQRAGESVEATLHRHSLKQLVLLSKMGQAPEKPKAA